MGTRQIVLHEISGIGCTILAKIRRLPACLVPEKNNVELPCLVLTREVTSRTSCLTYFHKRQTMFSQCSPRTESPWMYFFFLFASEGKRGNPKPTKKHEQQIQRRSISMMTRKRRQKPKVRRCTRALDSVRKFGWGGGLVWKGTRGRLFWRSIGGGLETTNRISVLAGKGPWSLGTKWLPFSRDMASLSVRFVHYVFHFLSSEIQVEQQVVPTEVFGGLAKDWLLSLDCTHQDRIFRKGKPKTGTSFLVFNRKRMAFVRSTVNKVLMSYFRRLSVRYVANYKHEIVLIGRIVKPLLAGTGTK